MKQYNVSVLTMNNTESGEFKKDESGLKIIDFIEVIVFYLAAISTVNVLGSFGITSVKVVPS